MAFLLTPDPKSIAETLVAFANTEGGTIVIGLKADGTKSDSVLHMEAMQQAMKKADELYNPPVVVDKWEEIQLSQNNGRVMPLDDDHSFAAPRITSVNEYDDSTEGVVQTSFADKLDTATPPNDKSSDDATADDNDDDTGEDPNAFTVYAMRVPRSIELHALSDGRVLIRSGDKNRPLGGQEILRLASAKSTGDFESEIVPGTSKEDFSRNMIEEYLTKRAERTKRPYNGKVDDLLQEIGAITPEGKPTVAGILLFSEYPQQWLPQSSVVFAKFVGTTPRGESGLAGYTRREELTGPLPRLIESAWNIIWSEMAVSAVVKGLEREEKTEYPQFAVREAIVNAICHRDYRLRGRRIELRMYSDRLEVISPGGLPGFITVENIKDEHFSRNPRIVNGLFQWGYIEELGLGIDRMMEVMEQAGHQPPNFDARPYSFAVTLFNEREKPKPPEWMRNTNHRQAKALQYIREQGSITNREYRQLCEGVSAETLRLDLVDMVEKGILLKVGSKKGTHYILK
ncbi:MAG: ATP-binding protein [Anaerolineae bacterium]|nr:ATP-binding protein [Anaerolineae bacterium]